MNTNERLRDLSRFAEAELPAGIASNYRSPRHLGALVQIGRILDAVGMTWASLHRVTCSAGDCYYEPAKLLSLVERIERAQPWPESSSAPSFMETLRDHARHYERVRLSARQAEWLDALLTETEAQEAKRARFTVINGGA